MRMYKLWRVSLREELAVRLFTQSGERLQLSSVSGDQILPLHRGNACHARERQQGHRTDLHQEKPRHRRFRGRPATGQPNSCRSGVPGEPG